MNGGDRTSEKKPNALIVAIVVCLAAFTILGIVSGALQTIDTAEMTSPIKDIVEVLKYVFTGSVVAIAVAFGRNIFGFGINYLREIRKENPQQAEYSLAWLTQTIAKFEGVVLIATPFIDAVVTNLPPEYRYTAMLVTASCFGLIDIIFSELKRVIAAARKSD